MNKIPFLLVLLVCFNGMNAQTLKERKHIQGGSELWNNFLTEMFLYPEFRPALIQYKDGQQFRKPVNYNRILKTIQFIDDKGDTLAIANEAAVKFIAVDKDEFIYGPQCAQSIFKSETINFYKHEDLRIADIRRKGALGIPNTTSAIESINQVYTWMNSYNLDVNELLLLAKTTNFYVLNSKGELVLATRKNILANTSSHKNELTEYLEKNKVNFSSEEQLVKLGEFMSKL